MIARKAQKLIYNILILCFLTGGIIYVCSRFIHLGNIEYTDNAQVKQHITPINTRVPGFIKKICFEEYQQVRKGDTLVIIEDTEFRLRVAQAEADLANATAGRQATTIGIATTQNNLSVNDASIEEVRVQMENARRELNRFEKLLQEDAVTKQQYDNVHTAYEAAKARYEQVSRAKQSTSLVKSEQTHRLGQNEAGVRVAEAALELARLNLVDSRDLWVIANYRETQLSNIREGAEVEMTADAVPDVTFRGSVESISDATGAAFSMIPQDNATGNFVKVEQRIPVRISLKGNKPEDLKRLRAGFNIECEVKY